MTCEHAWHDTRRLKRAPLCPVCLAPSYPVAEPASCQHPDFNAVVDVNRLSDVEGGPITGMTADLRIACSMCGQRMQFVGPMTVGLLGNQPTVDLMHQELRVPLTYEGAPEPWNQGPGFTVRVNVPGVEAN